VSPKSNNKEQSILHSPDRTDLTVAALLTKRREDLGYSLKEVEKSIQVRKRYLELIEAGDYEHLPDNVYSLGYIKSYADYLGFDTAPIINMYKKERLAYQSTQHPGRTTDVEKQISLKPIESKGFAISSKSLIVTLTVVLFVALLSYLVWQVAVLAAPPKISLNTNQDKVTTDYIIISGQTNSDADVFIDNSPILTNSDGSFSERVALINGSNQITVTAKNRLGKSTSVTKTVNAEIGNKPVAVADVSATPVAGVEMLVKIENQATWIVVAVDGQDAFRGIMLPGTTQLFKAKNSIKLTTGNAGNTQVIITNSTVAKKDLGILGRNGEAKNDLEFSKDTQFK